MTTTTNLALYDYITDNFISPATPEQVAASHTPRATTTGVFLVDFDTLAPVDESYPFRTRTVYVDYFA